MDPRLDQLLEKARSGDTDAARTLVTYLRRRRADVALLVRLAEADEETVRAVAALASRGREEDAILGAMARLAVDESVTVRRALAAAWRKVPAWPLPAAAITTLLEDGDAEVRANAVRAAGARADLAVRVVASLLEDDAWEVRLAAARALEGMPDRTALGPLFQALALDDDPDVARAALVGAERRLAASGGAWPEGVPEPDAAAVGAALGRVDEMGARRFPHAKARLEAMRETAFDPAVLASFGTDLTAEFEAGRLPDGYGMDEACARVAGVLEGPSPRAAVLLGEPGVGKTALVHTLVRRLAADGWRVLRMSASDFLAGTLYMGEWESKVERLVRTIARPRRIALYVPALHELSQAGVFSKSDRNVAGMLAPEIEAGRIAVLGESTPEAYRAGLGAQPALRRLFRTVEMAPASDRATLDVARRVCVEAGVSVTDGVLARARELAVFASPMVAEPGRTVGVLRDALERRHGEGGTLEAADLLATLADVTGVPREMLDDTEALDLDAVEDFLAARVRGQPEAVRAMVDLVALVKAGLTDPDKPYGVFLFVGPTGVGKTELARALAERLFGDAARLKRFDMSEYATFDAFERLIGVGTRPGLLTEAVRENPFAVFLLDEIEKAHVNVFDLCLQIFDAGRLTDARGRTADFRRSIFLMTSNVGSRVPDEQAVGFGDAPVPPPDAAAVQRALGGFFRPEFLGRLDRVVHFRPLAEETAEWIARREIARALDRSGIARRGLVVDVDPALVTFLLRRGYSKALGARPLKRTVEQHVLLPVARALAAGRVPDGAVLRLAARHGDVVVHVEAPEASPAEEAPARPSAAVEDLRARLDALAESVDELRAVSADARARRDDLLARTRSPGFWDDLDRARAVMGRIHRWEGPLAALDVLARRVDDTTKHLARRRPESGAPGLAARLDELEGEASRLAFVFTCRDAGELADAYVVLTRVRGDGADLDAVAQLARMYAAFARRRGFDVETLFDHRIEDPPEDAIALLVTGAGATGLLGREAGLHVFLRPRPTRGKKPPERDRETVRVEVLPVPAAPVVRVRDVQVETRKLAGVRGRLIQKPTREVAVLHRPTMHAVRAWTTGRKEEAVDAVLGLLGARVARGVEAEGEAGVVRRYEFGPSPLVRDQRTGRQSGRLERVLEGELEPFLEVGDA